MPARVSGSIEGMAGDFLYGPNSLPLSNGRRWLDFTCTHCLHSVFLYRLECRPNSCSDTSGDLFCDAFDSVVYISGQSDCSFGPSIQNEWKDKSCMSRIRILPEVRANMAAKEFGTFGGRSFSSDIKLKATSGFSP